MINRVDLAALVDMLEREHFGYNERGAAALRAYRGIEAAVESGAVVIEIGPPRGTPPTPPAPDLNPDQHEG